MIFNYETNFPQINNPASYGITYTSKSPPVKFPLSKAMRENGFEIIKTV